MDEWEALPPAIFCKRQIGLAVRANPFAAGLKKIVAERASRWIEQIQQKRNHLHASPHSPQSRARRPL